MGRIETENENEKSTWRRSINTMFTQRDLEGLKALKDSEVLDDDIEEYRIVGSKEADPSNDKISNESPLAQAILNARVGDVCMVESPNGKYGVKILEIM